MLSLALSMILYGVLVKTETLGSTDGFSVATPTFLGYAPHGAGLGLSLYWLTLAVDAIAAVLVGSYFRSVAGALAAPIRDNEIRVEFLGVSVTRLIHAKLVIPACSPASAARWRRLRSAMSIRTWRIGRRPAASCSSPSSPASASVAAAFVGSLVFELVRSIAVDVLPALWQMILGSRCC